MKKFKKINQVWTYHIALNWAQVWFVFKIKFNKQFFLIKKLIKKF